MNTLDGFSKHSIDLVNQMLYAEGQENPLEGQCNQKKKKQTVSQPRTPAQQQADQARALANRGKDVVPSATRSAAAKKAAATRRRCKGQPNNPTPGVKP